MTTLLLTAADIALFSDPVPTRVEIPHLVVADPVERDDATLVHLEGLDWPVAYWSPHLDGEISCVARFPHTEHAAAIALIDLFRTARNSADRRLQLRTNHGLVAGWDDLLVGIVNEIPRQHLMGQAWDLPFTLRRVHYTLEA